MKVLRSKIFIQLQGPLSGVWRRGRGGVKAVYKLDVQTQPYPLGSEIRGYSLGICRRSDALGSGTRTMPTPAGWNLSKNRRIPGLQPFLGLEAAMTHQHPLSFAKLPSPPTPISPWRRGSLLGAKGAHPEARIPEANPASSQASGLPGSPPDPSAERRRWMRPPPGDLWTRRTAAAARRGVAERPGRVSIHAPTLKVTAGVRVLRGRLTHQPGALRWESLTRESFCVTRAWQQRMSLEKVKDCYQSVLKCHGRGVWGGGRCRVGPPGGQVGAGGCKRGGLEGGQDTSLDPRLSLYFAAQGGGLPALSPSLSRETCGAGSLF